jgi:antitoxin HicB
MFYHFKIHRENKGYWAECLELEGCHTQAENMNELKTNMAEALNLYLSEPLNSKIIFPLPSEKKQTAKNVVRVNVETSVAFSVLLRRIRLQHKLTLREMASKLKYKNINTYVKLEKPKTANPELKTIANIQKIFSDFPISLIFNQV